MAAAVFVVVVRGRKVVGMKWEVKRRRRGRMVVGVRKLKATMTSETSSTTIGVFEREMAGCIER
jgi:hypothetical protein